MLHGYGTSMKIPQMLNVTFIRLSTPGVQKVEIYNTVHVSYCCCSCCMPKKRLNGVKSGTQNNTMSLLWLNMLSVLHYKLILWR